MTGKNPKAVEISLKKLFFNGFAMYLLVKHSPLLFHEISDSVALGKNATALIFAVGFFIYASRLKTPKATASGLSATH